MAEARRILVTGGGIAGLSLAIALRRRGLNGEPFHDPPAGRLERLRQHFGGFGPLVTGYLAALTRDE